MHFYCYYLQKKETHNFFKEEMKILHSEGNIKQRSFGFFHDNELCKNEVRKQCTKSTVLFSKVYFPFFFCQEFSSVILETQLSAMQVRIEFPSPKKVSFYGFRLTEDHFSSQNFHLRGNNKWGITKTKEPFHELDGFYRDLVGWMNHPFWNHGIFEQKRTSFEKPPPRFDVCALMVLT